MSGQSKASRAQAFRPANANRIAHSREHDWDRVRELHQYRNDPPAGSNDDVRIGCHQTCRFGPHPIHIVRGPPFVELDIAAVLPTQFFELLLKCPNAGGELGIALGVRHHNSNSPHPSGLLRARRARPRGCGAAEKRDEIAPPHGLLPRAEDHAVHVERYRIFKQALCSASQMGLSCPSRVISLGGDWGRGPVHVRSASNRVEISCTAVKDAKCQKQPFRGSPGALRSRSQTP